MSGDYEVLSSSSFGGIIGVTTASFYRISPVGIPLEPLADIVPAVTPFRVALSMIDREQHTQNYRVTMNALQDFTNTAANVHRELEQLNIVGSFSSAPPMSLSGLPQLPTFGFRTDLLQMANLTRMAELREPIMVVTPRVSLASAFIRSIQRPWTPKQGPNTTIVISLIEARIASPFTTNVIPDTDTLAPGNFQQSGGGELSTKPWDTPEPFAPAVSEASPTFGTAGVTGVTG